MEIVEVGSNPYSIFVYAIRSKLTRDYYLRRLRKFFDFLGIEQLATIEGRCSTFAELAKSNNNWVVSSIIRFLQFQKERVEAGQITGATLRNYVKAIKLFCEMSDIQIPCKKIVRGLPKVRKYAEDSTRFVKWQNILIEGSRQLFTQWLLQVFASELGTICDGGI